MEHFFPDHWSTLYLGLIFSITLAQMLVVYDLSAATTPPAGLGMFTVYALATLLSWVLFTVQTGIDAGPEVSVSSVAWIINGYLLYIAATQRAGVQRGRVILGALSLAGALSVLFLSEEGLFTACALVSSICFAASGVIFAGRGLLQRNVGDAIMCLAMLLMVAGTQIGLYQLFARDNFNDALLVSFGAYSWAYVLMVVGFLASVLVEYQQHLSHLATIDPMTQLLNRRGLEASLQLTLARALREDAHTAAIAIDIDHFKQINDSFGHETGDNVIRLVADTLSRSCRGSDVVARTGGEEFLLVMPETSLDAARKVAERLRGAIAEHPLWVDGQRISLTISLGVAGCRGETSIDQLQQQADRAMYLAKHNGRNRVGWLDNRPIHLSNGNI